MSHQPLTSYPSIDKPWLSKYPRELFAIRKTYHSIYERLKDIWKNENDEIVNYYGNDITVGTFFENIEIVAKSLLSLGIKNGDKIMVSLESVPEFIELLLAAELIGCSIKNYIGETEEVICIINADDISCYFAPDYLSQRDADAILQKSSVKTIIMIDPLFSADKQKGIREHIKTVMEAHYTDVSASGTSIVLWKEFLELGKETELVISNNVKSQLFCAYTSGTTGKPKEVRHSSESMIGVIDQLALFPSHEKTKDSWLLTILPPTLVAVVVAMMCYPLCDGKKLILDPYCRIEDLDLEMMYYEPECWALIPAFFDTLLESTRIPENYDMSYFKLFGFGAEPLTIKNIERIQRFMDKHNCKAPFSSGYGQSEGGSDFTVSIGKEMIASGTAGIPLIDTTISIFVPDTDKELTYNQVGEVCKTGPGLMLGYADKEQTDKVLKIHSDGNVWLHTGDYGFMTEDGLLFVLGRQPIMVYPDKMVFGLTIENKVLGLECVKEAIVVSGTDMEHIGYEVPYLFVVPTKEVDEKEVIQKVEKLTAELLWEEEKPEKVFIIDKKPISKFKTDRRFLQENYELNL